MGAEAGFQTVDRDEEKTKTSDADKWRSCRLRGGQKRADDSGSDYGWKASWWREWRPPGLGRRFLPSQPEVPGLQAC